MTALMSVFLWTSGAWAAGITYHGRLVAPNGRPVTGSAVQFKLQIRSPGPENCLMYEETHELDLTGKEGAFAITLGEGAVAVNTEPFALSDIFRNRVPFPFDPGKCESGDVLYAPSADAGRKLWVSFNDGTLPDWEELPPQSIEYVPTAMDSLSVGGYGPDSLLRVHDALGNPAAVPALTDAEYGKLMDVLAGTGVDWSEVTGKPSTFPPSAHGHYYSDLQSKPGAYLEYRPNDVACAPDDVLKWSASGHWECGTDAGGAGMVASIAVSAPLVNSGTASSVSLAITDASTSAKGVVQLATGADTAAGLVVQADDPRLSDSRAPTAHSHKIGDLTSATSGDYFTYTPNGTACAVNQTLKWVSNRWECANDLGLTATGSANQILGTNAAGSAFEHKTLTAGSGITITHAPNSVTIAASGSESTSVANVGAGGVGVYQAMSGTQVQLKNINAASSAITVTNDAASKEIDIGVNAELTGLSLLSANGFVKRTGAGAYATSSALNMATDATGILPVANGGTGRSSIGNFMVMGTNVSGAVAPVAGSVNGSILQYSATGPVYSTAAYPATTTANQLLYSSASNVIGGLPTATNAVLTTNASGVPFFRALVAADVPNLDAAKITTGTLAPARMPALEGDVTSSAGAVATTVASVGGVTAASVASGSNLANAATNANTASTIVKRDASGNFSAGTITANLTGNVTGTLTGNVAKLTTKGDLLGRDATNSVRIPVGANGQVLTADSAQASGVKWAAVPSGTVTSVATGTGLTGGTITATGTISLANTAVTAGGYGSSSSVGTFTVDAQGRLTSASSTAIGGLNTSVLTAGTLAPARMPALTGDITTSAGTVATSLSATGVGAGTYRSVTVDTKGRVTAGTNPTTVTGYGITDAVVNGGNTGAVTVGTNNATNLTLETNNAAALTILSGGNVGIGTASPGQKLTVNGAIESTSGGIKFPDGTTQTTAYTGGTASFNLYNGTHTSVQCESAGGLVRSIGSSNYLCQFTGASCPAGWTRLGNWGITHMRFGGDTCASCQTSSHEFSNVATETCSHLYNDPYWGCYYTTTETAALVAVGCY